MSLIKTIGLRPTIQTQLARRGMHLAGKKIRTMNADGRVQAPRLQLIAEALCNPPSWRKMEKAAGDTIEKMMRQVALHPPEYQSFSPPVVRVATDHPTTNPLKGDLADNQRPQAPMVGNAQIGDMEIRLNSRRVN